MDFDSIISIFLIFVFFVLPAVLKRLQAKKRPAAGTAPVKKKTSLFERIGEQIQDFVKDLEQQARTEKKAAEKKDGIWERLAEDDAPDMDAGDLKIETPAPQKRTPIENQAPVKRIKPAQAGDRTKREAPDEKPGPCYPDNHTLNSPRKLRQAVVWSEILGKPPALR
nr:hypothetical protein [Desulfobacula sp.]